MDRNAFKNGLVGVLDEDNPFVFYCNEKEYNGTGFLFECCQGCKHNLENNG